MAMVLWKRCIIPLSFLKFLVEITALLLNGNIRGVWVHFLEVQLVVWLTVSCVTSLCLPFGKLGSIVHQWATFVHVESITRNELVVILRL
jgi:hypothetical protein